MDPARDQIVARAFGRAGGQDRGLEFGKALVDHPPADRGDHRRAQHDVAVDLLAAQVEVAVLEPDFLGIILLAGHRHRQFGGGRLDRRPRAPGPRSRRSAGSGFTVSADARDDLALDRDDRFDAQPIERRERRRFRVSATICVMP